MDTLRLHIIDGKNSRINLRRMVIPSARKINVYSSSVKKTK